MQNLLSSPARLSDPEALAAFKRVFRRHGALQSADESDNDMVDQLEVFRAVPLVYGLMPVGALDPANEQRPLKPLIRDHLSALGIASDRELVDILQLVLYHYTSTMEFPHRPAKKKHSMRDLRSNRRHYQAILARQEGRCAVCGAQFDGSTEETLDHIIPWRLVGDPLNGKNWQILCRPCNAGKLAWISSLQSPLAYNWCFGFSPDDFLREHPEGEVRFIVLSQRNRCARGACGVGPRTRRLHLRKIASTGLPVADNLEVVCEQHLESY